MSIGLAVPIVAVAMPAASADTTAFTCPSPASESAPAITAVSPIEFTYGQTSSFTVCTADASTMLLWGYPAALGTQAASTGWLTESDNADGSFTYTGTPPAAWIGPGQFVFYAQNADETSDADTVNTTIAGQATPTISTGSGSPETVYSGDELIDSVTVADPDDCSKVDCLRPPGTIAFSASRDGSTVDCSASGEPASGPGTLAESYDCGPAEAGSYTFTASYVPASTGAPTYDPYTAVSSVPSELTVEKQPTAIDAGFYYGAVRAFIIAPDASSTNGEPVRVTGGSVSVFTDGHSVGTAKVGPYGEAYVHVTAPIAATRFRAVYSGDTTNTADTAYLNRPRPTVSVTVLSKHPETKYGWYRTPVQVTFACVTGPECGGYTSRTIRSTKARGVVIRHLVKDFYGGARTMKSPVIRVDRKKPVVSIYQRFDGQVVCDARDKLSGVATLTCRHKQQGRTVTWTARAVDRAGNVTVRRLVLELPFH